MSVHDRQEVVETLRAYLHTCMASVGRVASVASQPPRSAYSLMTFFFHVRRQVRAASVVIFDEPKRATELVRAAEDITLKNPNQLSKINGGTGLVKAWTTLLLDAAEKVKRERGWGDIYAENAEGSESEFAEASAREAGSRWRATS